MATFTGVVSVGLVKSAIFTSVVVIIPSTVGLVTVGSLVTGSTAIVSVVVVVVVVVVTTSLAVPFLFLFFQIFIVRH